MSKFEIACLVLLGLLVLVVIGTAVDNQIAMRKFQRKLILVNLINVLKATNSQLDPQAAQESPAPTGSNAG